jgi:hypothetical protein
MSSFLQPRAHIQHADSNSTLEPHWGYSSRVLPCTNDAGSCEYLDAVYWMHDTSMLYTFILWAVIGGLLMIAIVLRMLSPASPIARQGAEKECSTSSSSYYRAWRANQASMKRHLLPESFVSLFGNVTRLQLLVLAILLCYLLIFS